jgi:hypothetical protein
MIKIKEYIKKKTNLSLMLTTFGIFGIDDKDKA